MADTQTIDMIHQDDLAGHQSKLEPKLETKRIVTQAAAAPSQGCGFDGLSPNGWELSQIKSEA